MVGDTLVLPSVSVTVEAEMHSPLMSVRLQHVDLSGAKSTTLRDETGYRLDLALTPRPATRLSFLDRRVSRRFETAGRFFVLPPGQGARLSADPGSNTSIICHIVPSICADWHGDDTEWSERQLSAGADVTSPQISSILLQLANEVRNPGFGSDMLVQAYGVELIVKLQRYFRGIQDRPVGSGLSAWRLRAVEERLRDGTAPPSLFELAAICKLSVRHLSRGFRESRGISIGEYVATCRLDQAKTLLAQGVSIKAVAFMTGFSSASSFCHAFRKSVGLPPNQYRLSSDIGSRPH